MLYCSWDMARDGCNYFSFWAIFCPFTARKIKIWKKNLKKPRDIIIYISVQKTMIRWCTVPEIWCVIDVIVISHFGLFFPFYIQNLLKKAQKIKILKKWKKPLEISFYICVPKIMIRRCMVPEICCVTDGWMDGQTDGQTDRRMEKVTYRGGYPT